MGWKQMDSIFWSDPLDFPTTIILKTLKNWACSKIEPVVLVPSLFRILANDGFIIYRGSKSTESVEVSCPAETSSIWFVSGYFSYYQAKHLLTDEMMLIISLALLL
jgi:CPA2 family monovalent cation:H+ antiporter-2